MARRGWKAIGAALALLMVSVVPALAAGINSLSPVTVAPGQFPLPDPGCTATSTENLWITQGNGPGTSDFKIDPLRQGYIFQGATAPSCPFKYEFWWNTAGTLPVFEVYSGAAWVPISNFDYTNGLWVPKIGGGTIPNIASSSTTDLCSAGTTPQAIVNVTGASTIISFGSNCPQGTMKVVNWTGTPPPQVTYNASTLILPGAGNITPKTGDVWMLAYLGGGAWQLYFEQPASTATGVISFNGRSGVVVPQTNDYSFALLSGVATNAQLPPTAAIGTVVNLSAALSVANTSVSISADQVVVGNTLSAGGITYDLGNFLQTFNSAGTGANGMDIQPLPSSGNVCIYAIYNPTSATQSVLGVSCPTSSGTLYSGSHMPAGYTASALLGSWPTNGTPAMTIGSFVSYPRTILKVTVTSLTSGSGTYTTPTGATWLEVEMAGGGGGGGGAGNGSPGTAAGNTTFGTTLFTANLGSSGSAATGVPVLGGTATGCTIGITGGSGSAGFPSTVSANGAGGSGAAGAFGGSGGGGWGSSGGGGSTNSGAGGGGGGAASANAQGSGSGGGAGGYCYGVITAPLAATYAYSVGAAGIGAAANISGGSGGAGGAGFIRVKEHYGF